MSYQTCLLQKWDKIKSPGKFDLFCPIRQSQEGNKQTNKTVLAQ